MGVHPNAGKPVEPISLVDVPRLVAAYSSGKPDPSEPAQRVAFGTSGHRGSSLSLSFNEAHILAMTQAICERRAREGGSYLVRVSLAQTGRWVDALGRVRGRGVADQTRDDVGDLLATCESPFGRLTHVAPAAVFSSALRIGQSAIASEPSRIASVSR